MESAYDSFYLWNSSYFLLNLFDTIDSYISCPFFRWFLFPVGNEVVASQPICLSRDENKPFMIGWVFACNWFIGYDFMFLKGIFLFPNGSISNPIDHFSTFSYINLSVCRCLMVIVGVKKVRIFQEPQWWYLHPRWFSAVLICWSGAYIDCSLLQQLCWMFLFLLFSFFA